MSLGVQTKVASVFLQSDLALNANTNPGPALNLLVISLPYQLSQTPPYFEAAVTIPVSPNNYTNEYYTSPPFGTPLPASYEIAAVVPEPSTISLLSVGAIGLLAYAWTRRVGTLASGCWPPRTRRPYPDTSTVARLRSLLPKSSLMGMRKLAPE